jgi:hypothetical protein
LQPEYEKPCKRAVAKVFLTTRGFRFVRQEDSLRSSRLGSSSRAPLYREVFLLAPDTRTAGILSTGNWRITESASPFESTRRRVATQADSSPTGSLFGFEARAKGSWCGRRDLNPHGPCGPTDFHTRLRLSPPPTAFAMGFGVWTIPSPCPDLAPGIRCCPSSLYTFPARFRPGLARDRHVIGFPEFEQFCIARFPASTQVLSLKSDASADSATPARFQVSTNERLA